MNGTNKTTDNFLSPKTEASPKNLSESGQSDVESASGEKPVPDNLMVLNADPGAKDLNHRLQEMGAELSQLSEHLGTSHQVLLQKSQHTDNEVKNSQSKLNHLETSYEQLGKKSEILAKETARLALILNENSSRYTDSINSLEKNSSKNFDKVSQQIKLLDEQVLQLVSDYKALKSDSDSLISEISAQTKHLANSFSEQTNDFKKLAQEIEVRNKNLDSRLDQVGHNFSFHDTKILKLHEKDTELETKSNSLKDRLKQTETDQKETVSLLEKTLKTKITSVSDNSKKQHQILTSEHKTLENRTCQIESKVTQLGSDSSQTRQNHQQQLSAHDEQLSENQTSLHSHNDRLEQLKSVDDELTLRAEGLKKTTERLDEHSGVLEKTSISLRKHSHELQRAVNQLDEQNKQLENKTDELGLQIAAGVQSERQHFQSMTMAISIVAILTVVGLAYSFVNQQSLWQSNMDNDRVIERRLNMQLSEQNVKMVQVEQNLVQAGQQRNQLTQTIETLQIQLKAEQEKANNLLKDSEDKNIKIVQLKTELNEIDENVQFLNTSVGPLKDYVRNTGKQALNNATWLAQQSPDEFAIQLTSVDSKQKLYRYIEQYGFALQDELAWFTINSKGKDYYILTYGHFQKLSQARAVFSQLPSYITESSPGVSRLKDIQTFIH